jgi:hypothetical protein
MSIPEFTPEQRDDVHEAADYFARVLRASLHALAAPDPLPHFFAMMDALHPLKQLIEDVPQSFDYYYWLFYLALERFENPQDPDEMDLRRLVLARSGMSLLAIQTDGDERSTSGQESRLAEEIRLFDGQVEALQKARQS